jgi:ketohexokinase
MTVLRRPAASTDEGLSIVDVPFYPEEDSKLRATAVNIRRGGNCPNSLEVLQQLIEEKDGLGLHLVSCLPAKASPACQRIIDSFGETSPVDFSKCMFREAHGEAASSYIIRSENSGSRTLVNYNDLPEMTAVEFEHVAQSFDVSQETWWHFEVREGVSST